MVRIPVFNVMTKNVLCKEKPAATTAALCMHGAYQSGRRHNRFLDRAEKPAMGIYGERIDDATS